MARKIFKDFSANSLHVVLNNILGVIIFYITSRYLTKEIFGELNWSLATAFLIPVTGLGIELIIVRKIASGENVRLTAGLFFIHVLFSGILLVLLLLLCYLFIPSIYATHFLLPGILISQIFTFFSSPYKQIANGKSLFKKFAIISTVSNSIKALLLIGCLLLNILTIQNVVLIYIIGSAAEFLTGFFLTLARPDTNLFPLYWNLKKYIQLAKESLPQFGTNIFNVVLARFDWFLLGILTTATITAEYSFAYKVFELSRLPLLAISPVLIPAFVRIFNKSSSIGSRTLLKLNLLFRAEMILSAIIPVLLISCWTPLMESVTDHKYGSVNETVFLLLCVCVPLQFAADYYWNMCFAQNQLRLTFFVAITSGLVNILLNIFLIPVYGANGAAFAYIACFVVQLVIFRIYTQQNKLKPDLGLLLKTLLCASAAVLVVRQFIHSPLISVPATLLLYFLLSIFTQLVVLKKIKPIVRLLLMK